LPNLNPERGATTIEVTGPVTRAEVDRWRDAFSEGLARGQGLRIDLAGSGPWDLSGVQLLLAAIASGKRSGRPICLARVPNVLIAIAERAGLLERLAAIAED
jgi:ABC-type transporter Mla MlaB component